VAEKPSGARAVEASAEEGSANKNENPFANVRLSVDRRFARSSHLRFLTFVYNAANSRAGNALPTVETAPASSINAGPDLAVQVQVFRDSQPVLTMAARKIQTEGIADLSRVPYAADLTLEDLQPGRYVLQVTVIDRINKATATQRFSFQVD
jgi:hypothetical protein